MVAKTPSLERRTEIARALKRHLARLRRKVEALRGDLAEARRGDEYRRFGETLLAYLKQVPHRARAAVLPDPADPARNLTIPLDPEVTPQTSAARYFKRAAKAARGLKEVPPRLSATEAETHALEVLLARVRALEEGQSDSALPDDPALDRDLELALAKLPPGLRATLRIAPASRSPGGRAGGAQTSARRDASRAPSARLQPRRLRSKEGWDVLIGRNNDGNDYLTHRLARPEDYWFHVHGAAGSHVVLRRGRGSNEPSKATIEEVAGWAAFHSQARTAGKVPVIVTRKKYVRKPRKGPPGLALCTNEKSVIVRPQEPPRTALESAEEPNDPLAADG
ncbi:MAG TPA: NFACT RNA binding domain-containing protein [Candidatus Limnocylindria bacterium]|nr:NFACT RNA binding domain-containing protein [Candidatus Limnocylindria bacterium]